jgi:hypothetical protein
MSANPASNKLFGTILVDHRKVEHFEMAGNHMYGLATRSRGAQQIEVWFRPLTWTRKPPSTVTAVKK